MNMKRYDFDEGYRYDSTGGEYVLYEDAKEMEDMLREVDHHLSGSTLSTDVMMRDKIAKLLNKGE